MSHPYRAADVDTACPCCGTVIQADLWLVSGPGPEVDPATINRLRCANCGHLFLAPTPLLWHDAAAEVAYVYLPAVLELDEDDLVNGLLVRYMRGAARPDLPPDYLLSPAVYRDADEFTAKLVGAPLPVVGDELLEAASAWCSAHDAPELVRLLDLLVGVTDLPQFVATVNEHPELLEPVLVQRLQALGEAAEDDHETESVGELLRDLSAALRLHTPDLGDDDGLPDDERVPGDVRDAMAAGDLEVAAEYLERPEREDDDDFRRAMLTTLEPELREGFTEHARLFGGLVDQMIDEGSQPHEDDLEFADEEPAEFSFELDGPLPAALQALLAAPTLDGAAQVLFDHPELISREAVGTLRQIEQAALDSGDDGQASHVQMLIHTIYIAAADEEELEEDHDGS